MTRILHGNYATHIQGETTTICNCWEITLTNSTVVRITNHDKNLPFMGETFEAASGFDTSMLETGENLTTDNGEMTVILSTSGIKQSDIFGGMYDGARVKVWSVNWADTGDYCALPGGFLRSVKSSNKGVGVFELVSLSDKLTKPVGLSMEITCNADVGDTRCGVNLAAFTQSGTVTSVTDQSSFDDSGTGQADGYFSYGKITWLTGLNSGVTREVRVFLGGNFQLFKESPYTIEIGDTYSAHAGCDRLVDTCINKFSNIENFRAFHFIPGNVEMMSGPK